MKAERVVWLALITLLPLGTAQAAASPPAFPPGSSADVGEPQKYPEMEAALEALQTARVHLHGAATVFGGHRGQAERLTDQAIAEVREALNYAQTKKAGNPQEPQLATGQRKPAPGYPNMHDALTALRTAQAHLSKGGTEFGGHRVSALKLTNQAIDETVAALKYVHSNP
jgi:esterase/lipase superfamily enzyme